MLPNLVHMACLLARDFSTIGCEAVNSFPKIICVARIFDLRNRVFIPPGEDSSEIFKIGSDTRDKTRVGSDLTKNLKGSSGEAVGPNSHKC